MSIPGSNNSAESTENQLIRLLAKFRLRNDREARARGVTEDRVDGFSESELAALPESTLVHIVDSIFLLRKNGLSETDIINKIEMQRSLFADSVELPAGLNFKKYIKWRIRTEYPQISKLNEHVIDLEILLAIKWYQDELKSAKDWQRVIAMATQAKTARKGVEKPAQAAESTRVVGGDKEAQPKVAESAPEKAGETPEASGNGWKWIVLILTVAAAAAAAYWLLNMGGLALLKG